MPRTIIPTLDAGCPILTSMSDICVYLLRHLVFNPGRVSSFFSDQELSMRKLHSSFGRDPEKMASILESKLQAEINGFADGDGYRVSVKVENDTLEPNKYGLVVDISDAYGSPVIKAAQLLISDKPILKIKYQDAETAYEWSAGSIATADQ